MYLEKPSKLVLGSALLITSVLGLQPLTAQVDLQFSEYKRFRQVGPTTSTFLGGSLDVTVFDGEAIYTGCFGNGLPFITPPTTPGCPNGTTALIVSGDLDQDGISDTSSFWSIVAINRAQIIEPFVADRLSLYSSPSPFLPKPLKGFRDSSVQIFYNVLTPPPSRYRITRYTFERPYGAGSSELTRMRREVQQGTYTFIVPRLNPEPLPVGYPQLDLPIQVNHDPPLEAWPGKGVVPTINDFLLQNDASWRNGRIEIDPRVFFRFNWRGFNYSNVRQGDSTRFSLIDTDLNDLIVYPPYPGNPYHPDPIIAELATPVAERAPQLLVTPSTGIELPPLSTLSSVGYSFVPGLQLRAQLEFNRDASSGIARDTSRRLFEWDVYLVDTYTGYVQQTYPARTFPIGTTAAQMAPNFDFDGDGWTNLEEFALQTNPADAAETPEALVRPERDPDTNQIILEIAKRPATGDRIVYEIQYSYDRVTWTTIRPGDEAYFIEFDTAAGIKVRSRRPAPPENSYLRVRISQN